MGKRHAVIDIGSNTVRLVIFSGKPPQQKRLVDEKVNCGLARDLDETGCLSPRGIKRARAAIASYVSTIGSSRVASVQVVATSAVRDARDGECFVAKLRKKYGFKVRILSGDDEARLSAIGVISDVADANGIVVDLGGGSLELVQVEHGRLGKAVSAPLGHVRIAPIAAAGYDRFGKVVESELSAVGWLDAIKGGALYLSGGAWRKMARQHIASSGSKVKLQGYTLDRDEVHRLAGNLSEDPDTPKSLAVAASIIAYLLSAVQPESVTFSTRGLCDGCLIAGDAAQEGSS